jgi:hypothetical protein
MDVVDGPTAAVERRQLGGDGVTFDGGSGDGGDLLCKRNRERVMVRVGRHLERPVAEIGLRAEQCGQPVVQLLLKFLRAVGGDCLRRSRVGSRGRQGSKTGRAHARHKRAGQ